MTGNLEGIRTGATGSKLEQWTKRQNEMETIDELLTLEARLFSGDNFCELCSRNKEQPNGGMATYVAGSDEEPAPERRYVCEDCAYGIDPKLVDYVSNPAHRPPKKLPKLDPSRGYFGVCPECGTDGHFLNVGPDHWVICAKHGLKWSFGSNLFSSWRDETEETWRKNQQILGRFRTIKSYCPQPTAGQKLSAHGEEFRRRILLAFRVAVAALRGRKLHVEGDDLPF